MVTESPPGPASGRRVACAGAVVLDSAGRILLVLRGNEPAAGTWSLPGGRVDAGETVEQAVAREVLEETGLVVEVGPLVGRVERPGPGGVLYAIDDHDATVVHGELQAGDDAADAAWWDAATLSMLPVHDGLLDALREWGRLPR